MNPNVLVFEGIAIKWYTLLVMIGVFMAILYFVNEGMKHGFPKDFLFNMCFWTVIVGILGARIYYVVFNFQSYASDPISILKIWEGGLAIHGGLLFGFLTLFFLCRKYRIDLFKITDYAGPGVLFAQAIGRWGNFFNQEAHGGPVLRSALENLHIPDFIIDGMNIKGVYYEPTFLYESLWCLFGFIIMMILKKFKHLKVGHLTSFYLIWYSIGRFFIESRRTDSLMLGDFRMAQVVSVVLFILGIFGLMITSRKGRFDDLYRDTNTKELKY